LATAQADCVAVAAFAGLSGVAFLRLRTTLAARRVPGGGQVRAAAFEGGTAGLALGLFLALVGGGEPSVTPSHLARDIWMGVMGTLGACFGVVLWWIAAWRHNRILS
jgi:hypothetical protein